jgi:hypothetical protein
MIRRLLQWLLSLALETDKIICFAVRWIAAFVFFVILGQGTLPRTDQSISGFVGSCAAAGRPWAIIAQKIIDFVMLNPEHCQNAITNDGAD